MAWIGLNPSVADENKNDNTISKEITYSRSWNYGGLLKLNLYAFCATDPRNLWEAQRKRVDIVGQENYQEDLLRRLIEEFPQVAKIIAAWGPPGGDRGKQLGSMGLKMDCLMKTKEGYPHHPLYLPFGLLPEPWNYKEDTCSAKT